jgi:hypothetical protein
LDQAARSVIASMIVPTIGDIIEEAKSPQLGQHLATVALGEALHDDGHAIASRQGGGRRNARALHSQPRPLRLAPQATAISAAFMLVVPAACVVLFGITICLLESIGQGGPFRGNVSRPGGMSFANRTQWAVVCAKTRPFRRWRRSDPISWPPSAWPPST